MLPQPRAAAAKVPPLPGGAETPGALWEVGLPLGLRPGEKFEQPAPPPGF